MLKFLGLKAKHTGFARRRELMKATVEALDKVQAVIWFKLDGTIEDANANFLAAVGYQLDEIKGRHHSLFVDRDYAASPEYRDFWAKLGRGEFHTGEFKRFTKQGDPIWIEASYNPILDHSGAPIGVVKFAIDITKQKTAAADADSRLQAISRSQAVIEFDLKGNILTANENFLGCLGYELHEIVGRHHRMFCDPTYTQSSEYSAFWKDLAAGEFKSGEFQRLGKGGKDVWIRASYNPVFDAEGRPYKVVKYASDLTDQMKLVDHIAEELSKLAEGDLSARIGMKMDGTFKRIRSSFNATTQKLSELVGEIQTTSTGIARSAATIADGARDLASRAESQASAIEETAATMEEISATIKSSAENATNADKAANEAANQSTDGANVVSNAICAVDRIENSADKITEIISVIDSIAFQTNLLALNAAVEAARAGDAGKGFAVVASEVRTLAQRSSEAAKDITALINESGKHVADGAGLVRRTGASLEQINASVSAVATNIRDISSASSEQAAGVQEISVAISEMDQMTQRNAALAEQSAHSAQQLAGGSERLMRLIGFFKNIASGDEARSDAAWTAAAARSDDASPHPAKDAGVSAAGRSGAAEALDGF